MFKVNEDMVVYAFRYALGRMTYSVGIVSDYLVENWHRFKPTTRENIISEIMKAIDKGEAGMQMDIDSWKRVLLLEDATKPSQTLDSKSTEESQ